MKIGPIDSKPVAPSGAERKAGGAPVAKPEAPVEASAQVALSPAAHLLVKSGDDPAFDMAKVERIAAAIRDGHYRVNAEAIADKLIVNAEELLGRKLS